MRVPAYVAAFTTMLLVLAACSESMEPTQSVLDEVTTLDASVFGEPQTWAISDAALRAYPEYCNSVGVPVAPSLSPAESDTALDAIVAAEADAFEQAGWAVSRYTGSGDSFSGRAMVAERDDQILMLSRFLSGETLAYRDFTGCENNIHPEAQWAVGEFS